MTVIGPINTLNALEDIVPAETNVITEVPPTAPEPPPTPDDDQAVAETHADEIDPAPRSAHRLSRSWPARFLALGLLPGLTLLLALGAGYLKWQDGSAQLSPEASAKPVQAATESTIAMLSYRPDTAEKDLTAARDRLTGTFRDEYTKLIQNVVIPGAKQKQISAVATVPAAATVSATETHAVALVFVNQTILIGDGAPRSTASSVRVSLDKIGERWLISQFDPV